MLASRYCAPCNQVHDAAIPCQAVRRLTDQDRYIEVLEGQLQGWRFSDTALLIEQRDDARAALRRARHELGLRYPTPLLVDKKVPA